MGRQRRESDQLKLVRAAEVARAQRAEKAAAAEAAAVAAKSVAMAEARAKAEAEAEKLAAAPHPKPGRAPKGKQWDEMKGEWVDKEAKGGAKRKAAPAPLSERTTP